MIIILSGYNQRAVIAFIRTLEKHGLAYTIIARSADDSILQSSYRQQVSIVRDSDRLDLETMRSYIRQLKEQLAFTECMIAPSTEALNRLLVKYKTVFTQEHVIVPLTAGDIYAQISDKHSFSQLCRDKGLLVPTEYDNFADARIPFVAKPRQYLSSSGVIASPYLIIDDAGKKSFTNDHIMTDFYFQEFIDGQSLYLLYYFHRNGKVYKFSQQNLLQQPDGKSIIAAIPASLHELPISTAYEQLFSEIGFHGLVMVEIKHNDKGDYMIEANPRFWGPSQLFVDAGINLFDALLHDYGYITHPPVMTDLELDTVYFWYAGLQQSYDLDRQPVQHIDKLEPPLADIGKWIEHDIYNRPDTINIFRRETQ